MFIPNFFLILTLIGVFNYANANIPEYKSRNDSRHICSSIIIRTTTDNFKKLEDCEVIEGSLSIELLEDQDLTNYTFPLLTEITDYLLLYGVDGLRSLGKLFPNLSLIRGQNTLFGKSLIVYDLMKLEELGLYSLTEITHGQVYVDKNPHLCFLKTINWDEIVHEKPQKNFLRSTKIPSECPSCDTVCPTKTDLQGNVKHLCWNKNRCQKRCPTGCDTCNNKLECCNKSCLSCSDDNVDVCTVCSHYNYKDSLHNCKNDCPTGLYKYLNRRCVSRDQCLDLKAKIYQDSCILTCPIDYIENNSTCVQCEGNCKKECPGKVIITAADSARLKGCTHILGSLKIKLRDRVSMTELEENLKRIEKISGYLSVIQSNFITSLNFFKNLKEIGGANLYGGVYALAVINNNNLRGLWQSTELKIYRGKLFFHSNPKLCYDKILILLTISGMQEMDIEVSRETNGYQGACHTKPLNVAVQNVQRKSVSLKWKSFQYEDQRKFLGYRIYFTRDPYKNSTFYPESDSVTSRWTMKFIPAQTTEFIEYTLNDLNPYTQYAAYVTTYIIGDKQDGAMSPIFYFATQVGVLDFFPPIKVTAISNSSDSLLVSWNLPNKFIGVVNNFKVSIKKHEGNSIDHSLNQNYCNDNNQSQGIITPMKHRENVTTIENGPNIDETKLLDAIQFEDDLMNFVYVKRVKRELDAEYQTLTFWTPNTNYYIKNLQHFTYYDVKVQACNDKECTQNNMLTTYRTKGKVDMDKITNLVLETKTQNSVTLSWKQPKKPNGDILAYIIECKRNDNSNPIFECMNLPNSKSDTLYYIIPNLTTGNYSVSIHSKSSFQKEKSEPIYFSIREP